MTKTTKTTLALEVGDVVHLYGMTLLIIDPVEPLADPIDGATRPNVVGTTAMVVDAGDFVDSQIRGWIERDGKTWRIQGNELATWNVTPRAQRFAEWEDAARAEGRAAGLNALAWWTQTQDQATNTRDRAEAVSGGIDEGDPLILDSLPGVDLSGEWADGPTPATLFEAIGYDTDDRFEIGMELCDAYQDEADTVIQAGVEAWAAGVLAGDGTFTDVGNDGVPTWLGYLDYLRGTEHPKETCPRHGLQEVVSNRASGGSDPYDIARLRCGCEIIDLGDGPVLLDGSRIAEDRAETEPCERGTVGCSVAHVIGDQCEGW